MRKNLLTPHAEVEAPGQRLGNGNAHTTTAISHRIPSILVEYTVECFGILTHCFTRNAKDALRNTPHLKSISFLVTLVSFCTLSEQHLLLTCAARTYTLNILSS